MPKIRYRLMALSTNISEKQSGTYVRNHFNFMPYKLFELSQMGREQLETIAEGLQIKNIKKLTDENCLMRYWMPRLLPLRRNR